jgi:hypothetical protein
MMIQPVSETTAIIQVVSAIFVVLMFALSSWWTNERKIAQALRESSQFRTQLIEVEGPMTKAASELSARQNLAPSVQSEEQSKDSSFAEESRADGVGVFFR